MQKVSTIDALRRAIITLERRQIEQEGELRKQLLVTYESLKPVNVLRDMIHDLTTPSELKEGLLQTVVSLIAGYMSRKIVVRSSKNPFLRFAGILVEYGVTSFVSNHAENIRSIGLNFIQNLLGNLQKGKS